MRCHFAACFVVFDAFRESFIARNSWASSKHRVSASRSERAARRSRPFGIDGSEASFVLVISIALAPFAGPFHLDNRTDPDDGIFHVHDLFSDLVDPLPLFKGFQGFLKIDCFAFVALAVNDDVPVTSFAPIGPVSRRLEVFREISENNESLY